MDWKIGRAEHNEILILNRIDGLVSSNALYVLAYTGLINQFREGGAARYILYSFPVIMMVFALFTLYSSVVDSILTLAMRRRIRAEALDPEARYLVSPRWVPLYTTLLRSTAFPALLILLWAFLLVGLRGGPIYVVLPVVCVCAAGVWVLALAVGVSVALGARP